MSDGAGSVQRAAVVVMTLDEGHLQALVRYSCHRGRLPAGGHYFDWDSDGGARQLWY